VAHTCNPSYSGESWFKASPGKYFERSYLEKNPSQKRAGGLAQGVGCKSKPQYHKERERETERERERQRVLGRWLMPVISILGRQRSGGPRFEASLSKKVKICISTNKSWVLTPVTPNTQGSVNRRLLVQSVLVSPSINTRLY
jgi:hypothetical protein